MKPKILASSLLASAGLAAAAALAEDTRIVNEGGIKDKWMLADGVTLAAPGYPGMFADRGDSVCVAIGYAIRPDGTTSDFALLRSWNSSTGDVEPVPGYWDAFAQAGAGALSQWSFKPRPEVERPQPTYTVATMHFIGDDAHDPAMVRSHCRIADLAALVGGERGKSERERMRRELERNSRARVNQPAMHENPAQNPSRPGYRP